MRAKRTCRYTSAQAIRWVVFLLALLPALSRAQDETPPADPVAAAQEAVQEVVGPKSRKPKFLDGAAVGADVIGLVLKAFGSDWSQMEVFARLNFYDRYFPIFELGLGEADHEGRDIENRFRVRAPYFRVGLDYNFSKKHKGNRFFAGLRYGFSSYSYDLDAAAPLTDPVWQVSQPFSAHDLNGNTHWAEAVLGIETKVWSIVRLGWDMRFKLHIHEKDHPIGKPWYVPGYGRNDDGLGWGGTFKLIFDI